MDAQMSTASTDVMPQHASDAATDTALEALDPQGVVFLFSGQGAQKPGMGNDLADLAEVTEALACASEVVGFDIANLVRESTPEQLNDTRYAQPALCALSVGIARALEARGITPVASLGFSLGQISALPISGMITDEDTFALVAERADIMARAAHDAPGVMSALLKADEESVRELCDECAQGDVVVPANFNCPGQIVISGTEDAVARVEEAWVARGGRVSRLSTSGAFHSPLMAQAAREFADYLENVTFSEPSIPLICNVDAAPLRAADARDHLARHLMSPVLFEQSIRELIDAGAGRFAEIGYGGVLTSLMRRIDKEIPCTNVQDKAGFDELIALMSDW